jgi:glyoxylase-like metal-dependent hydrolase (beta-lactamase superfamily II)
MSGEDLPKPDANVESIEPEELKRRIDDGNDIVLLDTRTEAEFDRWHIDGENVTAVNVPYFEFLLNEDFDESLITDLPSDREITVLCGKGESSEYVAGLLAERGYDVNHLARGMNGWAGIYEYHELETDMGTTIAQYRRPSSGCLAYLIVDGGEAAVIDPLRAFVEEYIQDARALGAEITYAIDTHLHADHISGTRQLADSTGAEVVLPVPAAERGVEYDTEYRAVKDGEKLVVGNTTAEALHTPGHTSGMTSYYVGEVLFTGDSLFTESIARPDLEEGAEGAADAAGQLYDTLKQRILPLPDETIVAPAHFSESADPADDGTYTARLDDLRERMDVLGMDREEFVEFIRSDMPPQPANVDEIVATNLGHRQPSDEKAFTLELGPNNCAASQDAMMGD